MLRALVLLPQPDHISNEGTIQTTINKTLHFVHGKITTVTATKYTYLSPLKVKNVS